MSVASEGHVIDLRLINLKDPHIQIIQKSDALKELAEKQKKLCKQQFSRLEEIYASNVEKKCQDKSVMMKIEMKKDFAQRLETDRELTCEIDSYVCYSNENKRFFDVTF